MGLLFWKRVGKEGSIRQSRASHKEDSIIMGVKSRVTHLGIGRVLRVDGEKGVEATRQSTEVATKTAPLPSRRNVSLILAGLLAGLLLGFMDVTIVSTAGPTIVSDLGGLSLYAWVF